MANSQKFYDDVNIIIDRYSSWDFSTKNEGYDSSFMLALDEEIVSGKVFSLRISHGFAPKGASYRYEVKPLSK